MPYDLPKQYDPAAIEKKWAEFWAREELWKPNPDASGPAFTMLLPPPNVTGRLHMGHMLNQTEMDILARWRRMRGERVLWVPGTDHASIATQMMVERQLRSEGTTRKELGREGFLDRAWQWKEEYGGAITEQMRRLGVSVDWSREYFTLNRNEEEGLSRAVREAFVRLHEAGLIYRGKYIVNWDPVQGTAVSDLEVVHEERMGKLYLVRYPPADRAFSGLGSIVIATTRPETMLGDMAVAVNPSDERYAAFVGKMLVLPLVGREIPVIADGWANPEFGTGAVKVTPAHDPNDFAIGERHGLAQLTIMDAEGRIDLPGSPYHGLDRYAARERIVFDLEQAGLLVEVKDHPMAVGLSQRTGAVIEPRLSTQWFLRTADWVDETGQAREGLGRKAREAVAPVSGEPAIRFTPDGSRKVYLEWMDNIRDWCLSRQLWWGHRIPAWYCGCGEVVVARSTPERCPKCGRSALAQDEDVLDTWFSSGLLPFTVFGWPERTPDLESYYPTSLLVTGSDILFFWVARMVMLGCWFMGSWPDGQREEAAGQNPSEPRALAESVPFREVYIHALVRDANREKMSKTKGNVIDPIEIVERYGTDAVRFTLASMASPGTDIAFNEARTEGYRAFANKIWNAARFIFMQVDRAREAGVAVDPATFETGAQSEELEARWIRSQLAAYAGSTYPGSTQGGIHGALAKYRFDEAANLVYAFFWDNFCDWYVEIVKLRLQWGPGADLEDSTRALRTLLASFEASLRLLSPFMPFLTEELWHALYEGTPPLSSVAFAAYPSDQSPFIYQAGALRDMDDVQTLVTSVRAVRKELGVEEKAAVPVRIRASARTERTLFEARAIVERLARVSEMSFTAEVLEGSGVRSLPTFDVQVVYEKQVDAAAERERLGKDLLKYEKELAGARGRLGNESFLAKAAPAVIEGARRRAAELENLIAKARAGLEGLNGQV